MQKRSSQLNMQLTQLRKENTSIAEVRVWIPASLNFLRLSFCNCAMISTFKSSSCSSNIWSSYKFIIQLFIFNMVDNLNFVIHILQLVKPSWNGRNPLSVVVLKILKKRWKVSMWIRKFNLIFSRWREFDVSFLILN